MANIGPFGMACEEDRVCCVEGSLGAMTSRYLIAQSVDTG